jgi:hypothetical protein
MRFAAFALLMGCSYDWTVPASVDAPVADTAVSDTAVVDTFVAETAPSCESLLAKVVAARIEAKKCVSTALICMEEVIDECGCKSMVAEPGAAANIYRNAVADFKSAGCKSIACGTCAMPKSGQCLLSDGGGLSCAGP